MGDFEGELLGNLVEAPCPQCGYYVEFQLADAQTHSYKWCPCCRARIHLIDDTGSLYGAVADISSQIAELNDTLNRMFK